LTLLSLGCDSEVSAPHERRRRRDARSSTSRPRSTAVACVARLHDATRARCSARVFGASASALAEMLRRSRDRLAPASRVCWQRARATRADSHCCQRDGTGTRYAPVQGTRAHRHRV